MWKLYGTSASLKCSLAVFCSAATRFCGVQLFSHFSFIFACVYSHREFLSTKQLKHQGVEMDSAFQVNKYTWQEPKGGLWRGMTPKFELEVDERNGFLLSISTQLFKGSAQLSLQRANILLGVQMLLSKVTRPHTARSTSSSVIQ
jgi:hypothetical protein